jgi:hypothetical protein
VPEQRLRERIEARLEQTVFAVRRQPEESVLDIVGTRTRLENSSDNPRCKTSCNPATPT